MTPYNCPPIEVCFMCDKELGVFHHFCSKICDECEEHLTEDLKFLLYWSHVGIEEYLDDDARNRREKIKKKYEVIK